MKIDQIEQQIKNCADYVNWLHAHCNTIVQRDYKPFKNLNKLILTTDVVEAAELEDATTQLFTNYGLINQISLGRIWGVIHILSGKYKSIETNYKIFISHAHKDKDIIEKFTEKILRLGCAIDSQDIFWRVFT